MKLSLIMVATLLGASSEMWAAGTPPPANHMVITVRPTHHGGEVPNELRAADLTVMQVNIATPVLRVQRLTGDLGDMQLFVLMDDSTRTSSLGLQMPALKTFLQSLPATTQVAIGYLHNGTSALAQAFTADHQKAADALRLPAAIPGVNGSPYFGLSDLVKNWPSEEPTHRRGVLIMTNGVDRNYGATIPRINQRQTSVSLLGLAHSRTKRPSATSLTGRYIQRQRSKRPPSTIARMATRDGSRSSLPSGAQDRRHQVSCSSHS
jgi:hypothetical protein